MRAAILTLLVTLGVTAGGGLARAEVCPGDCDSNGVLTASDIGRMQSLLFRCGPCQGRAGAVAAGCAAFPGCPSADLNDDGCFTAAEFSYILRRNTGIDDPTNPGQCRVDKASFPGNKPKVRCDCNADGAVTAGDLGRLLRLTHACTTCSDGSSGAPAAGCTASPNGCPAADPDGDGCIRPGDVDRLCGARLH